MQRVARESDGLNFVPCPNQSHVGMVLSAVSLNHLIFSSLSPVNLSNLMGIWKTRATSLGQSLPTVEIRINL